MNLGGLQIAINSSTKDNRKTSGEGEDDPRGRNNNKN